jgi:hypothetical protein
VALPSERTPRTTGYQKSCPALQILASPGSGFEIKKGKVSELSRPSVANPDTGLVNFRRAGFEKGLRLMPVTRSFDYNTARIRAHEIGNP